MNPVPFSNTTVPNFKLGDLVVLAYHGNDVHFRLLSEQIGIVTEIINPPKKETITVFFQESGEYVKVLPERFVYAEEHFKASF